LENRGSKDDKVFEEIWKIVETKAREIQVAKAKRERERRRRRRRRRRKARGEGIEGGRKKAKKGEDNGSEKDS